MFHTRREANLFGRHLLITKTELQTVVHHRRTRSQAPGYPTRPGKPVSGIKPRIAGYNDGS
jgi:hypothetical protein